MYVKYKKDSKYFLTILQSKVLFGNQFKQYR